MSGTTPTMRTLAYFKEQGFDCAIVERFLSFAGKFGQRKDMFGFGDIVCMGNGRILAVQSCGQAFSEHDKKITKDDYVAPLALKWLQNGGELTLIGWRKLRVKRGGKAMKWMPKIKEYTEADFKTEEGI